MQRPWIPTRLAALNILVDIVVSIGLYKPFGIAGADVFTMRDGLVGRKDTYLDWLAYQRQVGIDPLATFKALGR